MTSPGAPLAVVSVPERQRPLRVLAFVLLCCADALIATFAIIEIANLALGTNVGNFSDWTVQVWGSVYTLDPPTFPWVVGILAILSVAAGWSAAHGRHFGFVVVAGLAWVALGLAALSTGSGGGLLAQRVVWLLLVVSARPWFRS